MASVSKGELRIRRMKVERLLGAVPTLELRRTQLTREMLAWEERIREMRRERDEVAAELARNPHPEIASLLSVEGVETVRRDVAGVGLLEVKEVRIRTEPYSLFATPPSFDHFVELTRRLLDLTERLAILTRSFEILVEERTVTSQRINLFEKRLIPRHEEQIRYIRGRLEDKERAAVVVARIAQAARDQGGDAAWRSSR